jgi:transposase
MGSNAVTATISSIHPTPPLHRHLGSQLKNHSPPLSLFGRPSGCIDQLSEIERSAIITLHRVGWTQGDIAHSLHCSENTVALWVKRWEEDRSVTDRERSGRPRCTSDTTDQDIMLHADAHPSDNPKDIIREMEFDVSARTVRRRLNEIDLHSCVQRAEHENVRARLQYARTTVAGPRTIGLAYYSVMRPTSISGIMGANMCSVLLEQRSIRSTLERTTNDSRPKSPSGDASVPRD